ncbi:hypothetical protein FA95DRAFT_1561663 [Auriscalpium vulgare]|uniref:Uncharacterized protein n=1 Tax=Auriscalpium vulgare TaxID=40419 RepID=A0ACB8RL28_9AGAM|nr:hypothetical protein FA95DRAFT_1561663 [Auriscalpium vulgare]
MQELRADQERQRRVLHNAAILQARDLEERRSIAAAAVQDAQAALPSPEPAAPQGPTSGALDSSPAPLEPAVPPEAPTAPASTLHPRAPGGAKDRDWQPEAWTPRSSPQRRG